MAASVSPDGKTARIRWTTAKPTRGQVEYGPTATHGTIAPEDPSSLRGTTNNRDSGVGYASNHRCDVPVPAAGVLHYSIVMEGAEGKTTRTPDRVLQPTARAKGKPGVSRVPIRIDRGKWRVPGPPVVAGVPFPPGHVTSPDHVRLVAKGKEIPSQVEVVSRYWSDHSIKWARVAFLAPDGVDALTLEYGLGVKREPAKPIDVKLDGGVCLLRTGGLGISWRYDGQGQATVLSKANAFVGQPRAVLVDKGGKRYVGIADETVVEEAGPVRAVARCRGRHVAGDGAKLFPFVMRLYAFVGKPYLRIDYTFENDATDPEMTSVQSIRLEMPRSHATTARTDQGPRPLKPGQRLLQREDFEWVDESGKRRGKRLAGIVDMPGASARVMVKNFWQQYPKALSVEPGKVIVELLPALPQGFYANRKDEDKLYYYIRDGLYTFRQGFSKTHELWMDFSGDEAATTLIEDGPTACADPAWIENSGVLRGLAVAVRDQFPGYDEALAQTAGGILARRESRREYGMMNFGDWYGERTWNWGNLEYDLGHGLLTQFARTGDNALFWRAQETLRHQGDVDTRRYAKDSRRIGQQWIHSMGHTAGYYPYDYKNMKRYASHGWSDNRGHVWAQGLLEHYLLGGDRRSWEVGLLISDWAAGPQTTNFRFGNAREPGWMTKLVMAAHYATDDPYYLNAAHLMVRKTREMSEASGGRGFYYHELPGGHCKCEDEKHYGEAGFMLGVLMTGMKMYYDATGDERVADDIVGIAKFIAATMWVEGYNAFRYTPCTETSFGHSSAFIMMEGLAFAAARSGDPALQRVCRNGLAAAWQGFGSGGKTSGYVLCSCAQGVHEFAKIPGPSFKEFQGKMEREMASPARRALPTLLHNPDFEEFVDGWRPRQGGRVSLSKEVKHSGKHSLKFEGKLVRQNEYFNTTYDTASNPAEIKALAPGQTYRFTCWLRVDKLTPGAQAPSARLAFRDANGTRGSKSTNAYDLSKMGTWQKLTVDAKVPDYNTRNYIALNTLSRDPIEAVLYLDDVSLVPAGPAKSDAYAYLRLDPTDAKRSRGLAAKQGTTMLRRQWYEGQGAAQFEVVVPVAATYHAWARAQGKGVLATLSIDGKRMGAIRGTGETWDWVRVGEVQLSTGAQRVKLDVAGAGGRAGRVVLTDDPSSEKRQP